MLFLKQVFDHLRLLLTTVKMAPYAGDHVGFDGPSALAQGVGLDVLVEQFVGVQFR